MILPLMLAAFGGILLLWALRSLRAHRLKERYVILLILTGLPFLALAMWPDALGLTAELMDIEYQTLMVLCLALFVIIVIFKLLSIVSMQERRITALAQEVGLLTEQQLRWQHGGAPRGFNAAGSENEADAPGRKRQP